MPQTTCLPHHRTHFEHDFDERQQRLRQLVRNRSVGLLPRSRHCESDHNSLLSGQSRRYLETNAGAFKRLCSKFFARGRPLKTRQAPRG